MKYESKKEKFARILEYGKDQWEPQPHNGQEGEPCPYGCLISKRVAPPLYYKLDGDCRAPYQKDCCMNLQYDNEYYQTRAVIKEQELHDERNT